jgi:F-type H+-transporting ATPase subunit delta
MVSRLEAHKIAGRYAKALFDEALQAEMVETWLRELESVSHLFNELPELNTFFAAPQVTRSEKITFVRERFQDGISPNVQRFLQLMAENDRLLILPQVVTAYGELLNQYQNITTAQVTTAVPMPDALAEQLRHVLAERFGYSLVHLERHVDPAVLGGVVVKIGDRILDGSFEGRLQELKRQMVGGVR